MSLYDDLGVTPPPTDDLYSQLGVQPPQGPTTMSAGPPEQSFLDNLKHGVKQDLTGATQKVLATPEIGPALLGIGNSLRSTQPAPPLDGTDFNAYLKAYNAQQPITPQDYNSNINADEKQYQFNRGVDAGKPSWGDFAGRMLPAAALSIPAVGSGLPEATMLGSINGGLGGLLNPIYSDKPLSNEDMWAQTGHNVGEGAVLGAAAGPVLGAAAGAVAPKVAPGMQYLIDKGIVPTPGESLGGAGKFIESVGEKIPLIQGGIVGAKQRAYEQFNRAAINEAMAPISGELQGLGLATPPVPSGWNKLGIGSQSTAPELSTAPIGGPAITQMNQNISKVYDDVLGKTSFAADAPFYQGLAPLRQQAEALDPTQAQMFDRIINQHLFSKIDTTPPKTGMGYIDMEPPPASSGANVPSSQLGAQPPQNDISWVPYGYAPKTLTGQQYKDAIGNINSYADGLKSGKPADQNLAQSLYGVTDNMRQALARQNPAMAQSLDNVDKAYAYASQINNAGARATGGYVETPSAGLRGTTALNADQQAAENLTGGQIFTPKDMLAAIRRNDNSANLNRSATNTSLGKTLPNNMQDQIGSMPAMSGTLAKAGVGAGLAAAGGALMSHGNLGEILGNPYLLGLGGASILGSRLYTPTGQMIAHYLGNVRPPGASTLGAIAKAGIAPATSAYAGQQVGSDNWTDRLRQYLATQQGAH